MLMSPPLQNAMRATIENHETSSTLPPIKVTVALGGEDLSIKVNESSNMIILENFGSDYTVSLTYTTLN